MRCKGCGAVKEPSDFYVRDRATGRTFSLCKPCHRLQANVRYRLCREKILLAAKSRRAALMERTPDKVRAAERDRSRRRRRSNPGEPGDKGA